MRLFRNLFRSTRPTRARTRTAKPLLEQLDDRLVPSTVGLSSAIGIGNQHYWYTVSQFTGQLEEFKGTTQVNLPGGSLIIGAIKEVSATVDPKTGSAGAFVLNSADNLFWCSSLGKWTQLPGSWSNMCATGDGHVYATNLGGAQFNLYDVYYLSPNTSVNVPGSYTDLGTPPYGSEVSVAMPNALAASVSWSGGNEVFAISSPSYHADGWIYVNSANAPGHWSLVDDSQEFTSLSAAPNNTVFAKTGSGQLFEETESFHVIGYMWVGSTLIPLWGPYWSGQNISHGMTWGTISADLDASGQAEVYAIQTGTSDPLGTGPAYVYDQGQWKQLESGYYYDICGANGGDFYDINYWGIDATNPNDNSSWNFFAEQFNPSNPSNPWTVLGFGLS